MEIAGTVVSLINALMFREEKKRHTRVPTASDIKSSLRRDDIESFDSIWFASACRYYVVHVINRICYLTNVPINASVINMSARIIGTSARM